MKANPVAVPDTFATDYEGATEVEIEAYEEVVAIHVKEPAHPDPLTSLYLPAVDAAILAERITATARQIGGGPDA
jgi:hypothetical protein